MRAKLRVHIRSRIGYIFLAKHHRSEPKLEVDSAQTDLSGTELRLDALMLDRIETILGKHRVQCPSPVFNRECVRKQPIEKVPRSLVGIMATVKRKAETLQIVPLRLRQQPLIFPENSPGASGCSSRRARLHRPRSSRSAQVPRSLMAKS